MRRLGLLSAAAGFVALAGCTVGPDYQRPSVALTPAYQADVALRPPQRAWWTRFNDATLSRLVDEALAQNLDLPAAAARLDQARAATAGAGSALLPRVDAAGSAERDRQSLLTPIGAASRELSLPRDYSLYQLGAQAAWEIDLFGGLRREQQAARADREGAKAELEAVRLSVAAETVDAYLQLRGLQARLCVAERQLQTERQLAALIRQQTEQGVVADRELNRVVGEAQGLEADLAPLRAGITGQIDRLDVLTGRQAGTGAGLLAAPAAIPAGPDPSGAREPAELMRRRPDLVAAERRLAAASARVGVAVADYYPHVSLSALFGTASVEGGRLFTGGAVQASGAAGLRWRLFDFGRVDAEVAQARGRDAETLAVYRGSVLRATQEVEASLSRLVEGRRDIALRERQVQSLTRSRDQARQAYAGGVLALVDVLDADRALLDASDRLAVAKAETARASLAAIRALGGGWEPSG